MVQSLRQGPITFENLKNIAIAGATGILGRWLVPILVRQGYHVRALTPSPDKARQFFGAEVEVSACDLLDPQIEGRLATLLAGYESVAHIATSLPRDLSAPGRRHARGFPRSRGRRNRSGSRRRAAPGGPSRRAGSASPSAPSRPQKRFRGPRSGPHRGSDRVRSRLRRRLPGSRRRKTGSP